MLIVGSVCVGNSVHVLVAMGGDLMNHIVCGAAVDRVSYIMLR